MDMKYSQSGLKLTEQFEGCRLHSYKDCCKHLWEKGHICTDDTLNGTCVGIWTIGYGHTYGVAAGQLITLERAGGFLLEDIGWAEHAVNSFVKENLTQHEFDALVDFVFNCGTGTFQRSDVLRLLNAGNFAGAAKALEEYDHSTGKVLAGLLRRRQAEEAEFNTPDSPPTV